MNKYTLFSVLPAKSFYGEKKYIDQLYDLNPETIEEKIAEMLEKRDVGNAAGWRCDPQSLTVSDFGPEHSISGCFDGKFRIAKVFLTCGGMDLAHRAADPMYRREIAEIYEYCGPREIVRP